MAKKNQKYDAVVKLLSSYQLLKGHIAFLENRLEELKYSDGVSSIKYDEEYTSKTNRISKFVEDTAIRNIEYSDLLGKQIALYKRKQSTVENCLEYLKPLQREIITLRYFEKNDWITICDKLLYSRAACYKHHEQAVSQLEELLYGPKDWNTLEK